MMEDFNKDKESLEFTIVDNTGELVQQGKYDSGADEEGYAIEQGAFGYVVSGYTTNNANEDMVLLEFVQNGEDSLIVAWVQEYGGSGDEIAYGLSATLDVGINSDEGFILVGYTPSYGSGVKDIYVVKTDVNGNMECEQYYCGSNVDKGKDIQQTFECEGGYIISGYTKSFGDDYDYWLIKTISFGETSP